MNGGGYGWERARARPGRSLALKTILWWRTRNGGRDDDSSTLEARAVDPSEAAVKCEDVAIVGKRWRLNQPLKAQNTMSPPSPLLRNAPANFMTSIAMNDDNSSIAFIDDEPTTSSYNYLTPPPINRNIGAAPVTEV